MDTFYHARDQPWLFHATDTNLFPHQHTNQTTKSKNILFKKG